MSDDAEPLLTPDDLAAFVTIDDEKATEMVNDAIAIAVVVAPCLTSSDLAPAARDAAKAILRGAVIRWNEAGSGALQTRTGGPWQQTLDTRQQRRTMFWPSEIEQLQQLCRTTSGGAFSIDTAPTLTMGGHLPWCDLWFAGQSCSCGANLNNGVPIYETDC